MSDHSIFHLAIPIGNIEKAKEFYGNGLGCQIGRANQSAVIFNFNGHQLVTHLTKDKIEPQKGVYPRHFGLIFDQKSAWLNLWERALTKKLTIFQDLKIRFAGEITEHGSFFLTDPFNNVLEFKYYHYKEAIFGAQDHHKIGDLD